MEKNGFPFEKNKLDSGSSPRHGLSPPSFVDCLKRNIVEMIKHVLVSLWLLDNVILVSVPVPLGVGWDRV